VEPSPERIEQYRQLVVDALATSNADLAQIPFNREDPQQLAVAVIYATIIEAGVECALLFQQSVATSAPTVLRSMLESFADLCATIKDRRYLERMLVTFDHERSRLLKDMLRSPGNPFHVEMSKSMDAKKELADLEADIKRFADRKIRPLSQRDRFECAGQPELIGSVYWQLCLEAHNNISKLEARHIIQTDTDFELVIFAERRRGQILMYIDTLLGILLDSARRVHSFLKSEISAKYQAKMEGLQTFRAEITAEIRRPDA
jgi:hypothetical protein